MTAQGQVSGGCACGATRFTAVLKGDTLHACHCAICRRLSAGPFLGIDAEAISFEGGSAPGRYASSEWASRAFCTQCGAQLAWILNGGGHVVVAAYALDEPIPAALDTELFIDVKPDGYSFAGTTTKLTGADVAALMGGEE